MPSLIDTRRSHALLYAGPDIQQSPLQRLEREVEPNVSLRGNRHSLPPDFLHPNTRTTDTSASSPHHARDGGQPLDEATIANRTAALRRLNGVAPRHRRAESARTRTSLSSQPIIVRTYSGSPTSRPSSDQTVSATMYDRTSVRKVKDGLPPAEVFSFESILQAIEREAREDVDAIAEICGRSKMSLANEYDAHMPPLGELVAARPVGQPSAMTRSSLNQTLTPVEEASSINERLSDNTQSIFDDANDTHQPQWNTTGNQRTRLRDGDTAGHDTRGQISISAGHAETAASASIAPAAIPTKAQQRVLEQSTLPVMLFSEAPMPTQEASITALEESNPSSQHHDSIGTRQALILTEEEVSNDPHARLEEPLSRRGVPESSRRQPSLLGSLTPWLSWTTRSSHQAESGAQSSGMSAASSLRSILATRTNQERSADQSVRALA